MYAIIFKLDQESLVKANHDGNLQSAYASIDRCLKSYGFTQQHEGLFFGDVGKVDAVSCVLAVMYLSRICQWFSTAVRDIRMLRIEEDADLMNAVMYH